jgi:hypothetical protein
LPGIELDLDYGSFELNAQNNYSHINVYNFTEHSQIPPDSWYKSKSLLDVFKGLRERGLIVGFAHIDDGFIPWQELSDQFDFFEITYNTCFEQFPPLAQGVLKLGFWDKWLSSGLNIPISTGSDSHQAEHAGFSMRNVLMTEERTEAAILKSFSQGKSYIAGTWHPDIYSEEGFSETYWFRMVEKNNRLQAFPLLRRLREKMFENNYGRIKKKSYPTLNMTLEGRNLGDSIKINSGTAPALKLRIKMNVPIHTIDLIANGLIIKRITPGTSDFAERISLSGLKGKSYLRAQIQGGKKKECREWLISNPIYIV